MNNSNTMQTNSIMLMANVNRSQIKITDTHYKITGIPITVDDAVMNDVHYSVNENQKGMNSMLGNPLTLSHPLLDGENVSGRSGGGLEDYFSGGSVNNIYKNSGVWYADADIKKSLLKAQDGGAEYAQMLENKESIAVSTGLRFQDNNISGVNSAGVPYSKVAINQVYDHLAMLANEAPAGGSDTVMRFNVADAMPEQNSWANKAWEAVKSVFLSNESSFDEISSKIYRKLNEDIDKNGADMRSHSYPQDVWDDHFVYRDKDGTLYQQSYALIKDEVTFIGQPVKVERVVEYETITNQDGDSIMNREQIIAILSGKGISVNAEISDADLTAELTKAIAAPDASAANANDDVPSWAETLIASNTALNAKVEELETSLSANKNVELEALSTQMKAMTSNRLSDSVIGKMDTQEMKDHLAEHGQIGFNLAGGQHSNSQSSDELDATCPE